MDNLSQEVLIIAGITLFFLILSIGIISLIVIYQSKQLHYFKEKKEMQQQFNEALLQSQLETHEATLHQISEEIHDNIGQLLSSTKMLLGITERNLDTIPDTLRTAEQTLGKAIQDLRSLSKSLNKEWLHQFNITDNLKAEVERINTSRTIHAEYFTSTSFLPLKADAQLMLFRIVQEAMQNSIKHARAQRITIRTLFGSEQIKVTVDDDGIGMSDSESLLSGIGMMNMQHRTRLLGGSISWNALPVRGTQVLIHLPVQQQNL